MPTNPGDQMSLVKLDEYASKLAATRQQYDLLKSRCESNSDLKQLVSPHVDIFGRYIQTFTSIEKTETLPIFGQIRLDLGLCSNTSISPAQVRVVRTQLSIHIKKLDEIVSKHRDILTKVKELQAPLRTSLATARERADAMERRANMATVAGIGFAIVGSLLASSKSDHEMVKRGTSSIADYARKQRTNYYELNRKSNETSESFTDLIDSSVQFLSGVAGVIRVFSSDLSTITGTDSGSRLQLLRAKGQAAEVREMMAKYIELFQPVDDLKTTHCKLHLEGLR